MSDHELTRVNGTDRKRRQLALDTDVMTTIAAAVIWLCAVVLLFVLILTSAAGHLPQLRPTLPASVGLPPLFSREALYLLLDAFLAFLFVNLIRSPLMPKGFRLWLGAYIVRLVLSILERLVRLPDSMIWLNYGLGLVISLTFFLAVLIGVPLWVRSKIRYV